MKVVLKNNEAKELEGCDIGLGYLASGLLEDGHDVQIWLREMKDSEFCQKLVEYNPEVVGIKVLASGVENTIRTIELIRKTTKSLIVIGGPYVSRDPGNVLTYIPADYAFQGEADLSFLQFVTLLEQKNLKEKLDSVNGLIYRKNGTSISNPPDLIKNLDDLPFPAWDLMPPNQYESLVCKAPPAASVMITRGCTNNCTFCAEGGKRLRFRSVENVLTEITCLVERFGIHEIQFLDSNFLFSKKYLKNFCHAVLNSGLKLAFSAPNGMRLEALDEELCQLLARIGFYRVNLGIESGSPEILQMVKKRTSPEIFSKKVPLLRKYGIYVVGNFMLGFPGETKKQMQQTLDLALSLDLAGANFSIYTPFPGTPLFQHMMEEGKIERREQFQNYNYVNYENKLSNLSPQALRKFRNWCVLRFLLRWKMVKTLFKLLQDRSMRRSLMKRIYGMYLQKYLYLDRPNKGLSASKQCIDSYNLK